MESDKHMIDRYFDFLNKKEYPCIAAKAAISKGHVRCFVTAHMACPADDLAILEFLYAFVDEYRTSRDPFHSAAIIFAQPVGINEDCFEQYLWQRLNNLMYIDRKHYEHDTRVDSDPSSPNFCFSLKEEAFFIIGLHPGSSRKSRQFAYPTLVFNPHAEFEKLRNLNRYARMKDVVRSRDIAYSGSVNPMLDDYGSKSEVVQYSGRRQPPDWVCPLKHI
jgi:FPC/CPF motif-containing protein YcgG